MMTNLGVSDHRRVRADGGLACVYLRLADASLAALARCTEVQAALAELPDAIQGVAGQRTVVNEHGDLCLLDAALWTYARDSGAAAVDQDNE